MKKPELPPTPSTIAFLQDPRLAKLMMNTTVFNKLTEINRSYPYWDQFKHKIKSLGEDPVYLWHYSRMLRHGNVARVSIGTEKDFQFTFNSSAQILRFLHEFDLNLGGQLEGKSIIPTEEKGKYLISSIMEEAIASSQLEGAVTTREIAKEMLRSNRKPRTIDEKMILNNYVTIKKVLELKNQPISVPSILELHRLITNGTLADPNDEGTFRKKEVSIFDDATNEIFYTPPTHDKIDGLMDKFCQYANNKQEADFTHPIIKGIILHFLIGYIHPFADGNGRTARALFYWYLISQGYWLVEYMSISKIIIRSPAQYARAYLYSEYDQNDLTYFIAYNLKCMDLALKSFQAYVQRKVMEKNRLIDLLRYEDINERQLDILRGLIVDHQKSLTVKEVQTKFNTVYQTARTDLLGLAALGYIENKKIGKKLIFFKAANFDQKLAKVLGRQT